MQFQGFDWLSGHVCMSHYTMLKKKSIKLSSASSCKAKSARYSNIFLIVFNKTIIPLALVGYDIRELKQRRF